jgi:P4 family phage/plasmid primase-like protien
MEKVNFIPEQLWNNEFRFLKLRPKGKEPTYDSKGWQENNFRYNDEKFMEHIVNGGNYGIIGGYGNLVLIDSDSPEVTKIAENMPNTLTIKTGSPENYKKHYYYITDKKVKPIRLTENKLGDLGDVRSVGQYVVGPNSVHPKGGTYEVLKDLPIATITEEEIREFFKTYIEKGSVIEFKEYPIETKLRDTPYIKHCQMPDFLLNNKLPKGNTAKNWKLFRYIADILRNRKVPQEYYQNLVRKQGHSDGAIKGWVVKAHEGKLGKSSCRIMKEYIKKYYPDLEDNICKGCPLNKKCEAKKKIESREDLTVLQKDVLMALTLKDKDKATELIVKKIEGDNHIYTTKDDVKSEMWIYQEGIYVPQGKSTVKEITRRILMEAYSTQLANTIISKIEADTQIEQKEFFNTNYVWEVPLINGILNLKTRELNKFDPLKIFFNKLPVEYDADADCPNILEHLSNVLSSDEDVRVMLEIFGFSLLKEYRIEKAFMFVGNGRNGKSKTIELLKRFLGAENCSSLPLKSLSEESFSLSELFGRMANLAADLSKTDLKETGTIKNLIGRDTIQAKRKFLTDLNFVNYAKLCFAANDLPRIYDTTDGFWTKWVLLDFPNKFVTQEVYNVSTEDERKILKIKDDNIIEKLSNPIELSGLLNYALDGLDRLLEQKDFSYSKSTSDVKDMWIRKSDSFTAFCYDHLEEDSVGKITKRNLRKVYHKYIKKHIVPGCSDKAINITLSNMFGVTEFQNSNYERTWEGIKFKNLEGAQNDP